MTSKLCKVALFVLLLLISFAGQTQTNWSLSQIRSDSSNFSVGIRGEYFLNSNVLDNNFVFSFLGNRNFIESDDKDRISDRLTTDNRVGADLNSGVFFSGPLRKGKNSNPFRLSYFVALSDRQHFHAKFSEDAFKLGFYGNKRFAGDTAHLGGFELQAFQYQQLQTGLLYDNGLGRVLGVGISLLKGQRNQFIEVDQLDLFTSTTGDYLSADTRGRVRQNDSSNTGIDAANGWGSSIDLLFETQFNLLEGNRHGNGLLRMEVNDLGYLWWNNQSLNYRVDSLYEYEGIFIDNLFQLNDSVLQANNPDSIVDEVLDSQARKAYRTFLPGTVRLTLSQDHHQGFNFSIRFEQRLGANYRPLVLVKESYQLSSWLRVAAMGGIGGYGRYYLGAEAKARFGGWEVILGSNSLEGVILPKNSSGNNGYLALRTHF